MEQLELCVDYLWKSERHELIADINKPVIAVFEKRRDFKVAAKPSSLCARAYWADTHCTCVCVCVPTEAVGAVLWHPSLLSQGDWGGELRKAALWSLLPCSFLWTGERQFIPAEGRHTHIERHTYGFLCHSRTTVAKPLQLADFTDGMQSPVSPLPDK